MRTTTSSPDIRVQRVALQPVTPSGLPCELEDQQLWFSERPAELEQAKSFCGGCPVREDCLAGALRRREYAGVWGGEIFDQGNVVAFKRARGRPRKHPLPAPRSGEHKPSEPRPQHCAA
jgi:WhiB family redox-sensing transcriptional regulator